MKMENDVTPFEKLFHDIMGTDILIQRLECCKVCFAYGIDEDGTPFQVFKGTKEEMIEILKKLPELMMSKTK